MIYTVTNSRQDRRPNKSRESSHRCLAVLVSCPLLVVLKLRSISCCMSGSSRCHNSSSSRFSSIVVFFCTISTLCLFLFIRLIKIGKTLVAFLKKHWENGCTYKLWSVRSAPLESEHRIVFLSWQIVVRDNVLSVGDLCVSETVNKHCSTWKRYNDMQIYCLFERKKQDRYKPFQ